MAYADDDFLCRRELRPVRLQLELLKAGMILDEAGIRSTVVLFGGARIPEPGRPAWAAKNETQRQNSRRPRSITTRRASSPASARNIRQSMNTANSSS